MLALKMSRRISDCGEDFLLTEANPSRSRSVETDATLRDACDSYRMNHAAWRRLIEANPEIEDYDDASEDLGRYSDLWRDSLKVIMVSAPSTPEGALLKLEVLMEHSRWASACSDMADLIVTSMIGLKNLMIGESGLPTWASRSLEQLGRQ